MIPQISIVTPSYNQGQFIEETFVSVTSQRGVDVEYIVIDGGSSDNTGEILECYRSRISTLVVEPDKGQTDALIKGFKQASGEILAWLNSDDVYEAGTLNEVASIFEENPEVDFIYGDAIWIDKNGRFLKTKKEIGFHHFTWLHTYNYIPQPSAFWRRSLYDSVGGPDPTFELAMDADLFWRFAGVTKPRHLARYWSRMRSYPEQKNKAFRTESNQEDDLIRRREGLITDTFRWRLERRAATVLRVALKAKNGCYLP
ncbi:glycosyltransferase family 2 protein [soil metagenome]